MLDVLKPSTTVRIGGNIEARVLRVNIAGDRSSDVSYEVVWWDGRQRKRDWLSPAEVEPVPASDTIPVGFRSDR
jgi:hypothetical protein